jgi:flavin-binding protein dodecin
MGSYLLVANQTSGGEALATQLRRVIASDADARFVVLVPVSTPSPVDLGGAMGVMSGVAVLDASVQAQIQEVARERLARIVAWLRDAGAEAEGSVVSDAMAAMESAVDAQEFDEIIVSTVPARLAQWLRRDLTRRATRRFAIPVTTVMAADPEPPVDAASSPAQPSVAASAGATSPRKRAVMGESVYKIIELVGTSTESWEKAAAAAVTRASARLRDLRVAEVVELDMVIEDGAVAAYRAKIKVSFKYEGDD